MRKKERLLLSLPLIFIKTKATVMKIFMYWKMIIVTFLIFLKTLNIRSNEKNIVSIS